MDHPRKQSVLIRLIYAACFGAASFNHARIIAGHGLDGDYGGVPAFVSVFWTGLTFIDALAVILLMARPRLGLALTVAIIVCDVVINSWVAMNYGIDIAAWLAQVAFLLFVVATVRTAWRLAPVAAPRDTL